MTGIHNNEVHPECPSLYALERARLNSNWDNKSDHVDRCPECRQKLAEWDALDLEFETKLLPKTAAVVTERVLAEHRTLRSKHTRRFVHRPAVWAGMGMAAAATVAILLSVPFLKSHDAPASISAAADPTYLGDKGAVGLELYCNRNDRVFRVHQGMTLLPNDQIRFVPRIPGPAPQYVMVISVDSRGTISRYFPPNSNSAASIETTTTALPGSIILDDTPGWEHIWMLSAPEPFAFEDVRAAAQTEWRLRKAPERMGRLPVAMDQNGLLFRKDVTP